MTCLSLLFISYFTLTLFLGSLLLSLLRSPFSGLRVGPSFAFLTALIVAVGPSPTSEDSVSVRVICVFPDS